MAAPLKPSVEPVSPEKVGRDALAIADDMARRENLIETRDAKSGLSGKWRVEHGLGDGRTAVIVLDGEKDLTGRWRHETRLEVSIFRGGNDLELGVKLCPPNFSETDYLIAPKGAQSANAFSVLAPALSTVKKLRGLDAASVVEGARAATEEVVSPQT
ncbi:MAG: hypothetical protein V1908_02590 [Candidatus Peregrinibacteria bacterium]